MSVNRDTLENVALETVNEGNYHRLESTISTATDDELEQLIACGGNYELEEYVIDKMQGLV